ncbi:hypothetical protein OU798_03335 [Prolixibacteraceae bacterium Z1-6]|uniref:beta-galactosidase n=1 Tax=Draconibacterium aestuarii TaxID=2998507 RepID=A0A9X3F3W8_9BACT|nr:hypothetical protein [Prolixibacteraceae bacterium Z1-6]
MNRMKGMKMKLTYLMLLLFNVMAFSATTQSDLLIKDLWKITGRGEVFWRQEEVRIKDCLISLTEQQAGAYEFSFEAQTPEGEEQVQIWSGFGFQNRDNRYALGLRGGNNNDLYLCRYQDDAKSKMLALESLDFEPKPGEWHKIKLVFFNGHIRVYLNGETSSRIVVEDEAPLPPGKVVLGGGWISTVYRNVSVTTLDLDAVKTYQNDDRKFEIKLTSEEKEAIRKKQRAAYKPVKIASFKKARTSVSLEGNWLFCPEQEVRGFNPGDEILDDNNWHVMEVPQFWNTVRNWLHLQDSGLPHKGSGISDNYREKEYARIGAYTFDAENTTAAWYRHHLLLPKNTGDKRFILHFDAVSKVADVFVNGHHAGSHIGMFGDFDVDITDFVKPGNNVIAVNVKVRQYDRVHNADEYVTTAVSVEINNDMLNSLPHGMFKNTEGGIWQPVSLEIVNPVSITDVFANTKTDGGNFEISLKNTSSEDKTVETRVKVTDKVSKKVLFESSEKELVKAGAEQVLTVKKENISPKLWSPHNPNLYVCETSVYEAGQMVDKNTMDIGFRTFEINDGKFVLNGNDYWLGGANHPPCGIAPNNEVLAQKFFGFMNENNQMVTRSHGCPFTKAWMDAADEQGVGVSYEGPFPWFMIGEMPSPELIEIWRNETLALVKKYRNHPSLLVWTINNEMYFTMFYHNDPPEIRLEKWKILSDVIKEIRRLSPNAAISADSGYSRVKGDYDKNLAPHGIDDGDIDDRHIYNNWYNRDFFQMYNGEWAKRIYWSPGANPGRAFFSQETSTGYTNNDDGHFNRKYMFNNYVPQSWLGNWAYEDHDPKFTFQRRDFMTKELVETIRRTSSETAGLQLFANVTWFRNVHDAERIEPYPVNYAVKKAYQPVLVSAELFGRSFYAGATIQPRVCIINNNLEAESLPSSNLKWEIVSGEETLASGEVKTEAVPFYERQWFNLSVKMPAQLPAGKMKCQLVLSLENNDKVISKNDYDITIAEKKWAASQLASEKTIGVFDITGETNKTLNALGVKYVELTDLTEIRFKKLDLIIVANLDADNEVPYNWEDVRTVMGNGTNVLLVHPGKHMQWLMYDRIESVYEREGRVVNMHIPEHPVFNEIEPLELAWWQPENGELPRACKRSYRLKKKDDTTDLCTYLRPHTGLSGNRIETYREMSGIPLLLVNEKKGTLIASEMEVNRGTNDPVAGKLLTNIIDFLLQ